MAAKVTELPSYAGVEAMVNNINGGITHYSEFSGCGGTSHGASMVPGVETIAAANHKKAAIQSHELNFPNATHFQADLTKLDIEKMPWCHLFTASPACPAWTTANGVKREFDKANAEQPAMFTIEQTVTDPATLAKLAKEHKRREEYRRSRLLMKEVPRYLRAMIERGTPVPIAWVENVIQVRLWHEWDSWIGELRKLGYKIRIIALNSMHARPVRARKAPQSRNRAYIALWHKSLGRDPDWDKWLRPQAFCPQCAQVVDAVQVWKKPGMDMGSYGRNGQYIYQCPNRHGKGQEVFPAVVPALSIIDPSVPGIRIGDRSKPPVPNTLRRIAAGIRKHWLPLLTPVGGTWRADGAAGAQPLNRPFPTVTTRETDALAVPPLMIPVEGRDGKNAWPADQPMRTQTARNETGVVMPMLPELIIPMRGGGDLERARLASDPLTTVSAQGNHHGYVLPPLVMRNNNTTGDQAHLCTPAGEPMRTVTASGTQSLITWQNSLLVPFYSGSASAHPASDPIGTVSTREHHGLADGTDFYSDLSMWDGELSDDELAEALADVLFRMLTAAEIGLAMAFDPWYRLSVTSNDAMVDLYGNAVTPNVAEVITSALVECLTGVQLQRQVALAA